MTVLVVCEQRQNEIREISYEAVGAGRSIASGGEKVIALLLGSGTSKLAVEIAARGPDEVVSIDSPALQNYTYDAYRHAILSALNELSPEVVVSANTSQAMDLFPGVAVAAGLPMLPDCIELARKDGTLTAVRQLYGGKIEAGYALDEPCVVTIRQGVYPAPEAEKGAPVRVLSVDLSSVKPRTTVKGYATPTKEDVDIEKARIVVSVGRGIEKQENLPVFEELVSSIDGAVLAGSRPIIDSGWLPKGRQVGVSGKTVRPKLYLALGISGAIQHISGMSGSEFIVAVNRDRDAPIFKVANVGIVDDIFKVVPALVKELKKG